MGLGLELLLPLEKEDERDRREILDEFKVCETYRTEEDRETERDLWGMFSLSESVSSLLKNSRLLGHMSEKLGEV